MEMPNECPPATSEGNNEGMADSEGDNESDGSSLGIADSDGESEGTEDLVGEREIDGFWLGKLLGAIDFEGE